MGDEEPPRRKYKLNIILEKTALILFNFIKISKGGYL